VFTDEFLEVSMRYSIRYSVGIPEFSTEVGSEPTQLGKRRFEPTIDGVAALPV